jgi:hypothetical protein
LHKVYVVAVIGRFCIDKSSSAELSEAINSMFRWYKNAVKCYVYLSDISIGKHSRSSEPLWEPALSRSRWFTRGWTLQELLAPPSVEFFSREGKRLGDRRTLEFPIQQATDIATEALQGRPVSQFSVEERMSWAKNRETTREEDRAYCLMGIFNICLPVLYGEGVENAFKRLQEGIEKASDEVKRLQELRTLEFSQKVIHEERCAQLLESLRFDQMHDRQRTIQRAHDRTCKWLLENSKFRNWWDWNNPNEHHGFFWLKGNPGVGKSTLTKFALSESKKFYQDAIHISFFFNRRGANLERDILGMYRSLLSQLLDVISHPEQVFAEMDPPIRPGQTPHWTVEMLKDTLDRAIQKLGKQRLFLFIDALDECVADEFNSQIQDMVAFFQGLGERSINAETRLNIFFSSRHYPAVTINKGFELKLETEEDHTRDIEILHSKQTPESWKEQVGQKGAR